MFSSRSAPALVVVVLGTTLGVAQSAAPVPAWSKVISSWPVSAAPIAGDTLLFAGTPEGKLYAINRTSGVTVWSKSLNISLLSTDTPECVIPLGINARPALWKQNVYVADGQAVVHAFDQATGIELWKQDLSQGLDGTYIWTDLLVVDNALYGGLGSATGQEAVAGSVFRIDLTDPGLVTRRSLMPPRESGAEVRTGLVFDRERQRILVETRAGAQDPDNGSWGNALLALDPATLEIQASFFLPADRPGLQWSSPPMFFTDGNGASVVAAFTTSGELYGFYAVDLSYIGAIPIGIGCMCVHCGCSSGVAPISDSTTLYVGTGITDLDLDDRGALIAMDFVTGLKWTLPVPGIVSSISNSPDGTNLLVNTTRGLLLVNSATGLIVQTLSGPNEGPVTFAGNSAYRVDTSGSLTAWLF